jgi:hypothetical protein
MYYPMLNDGAEREHVQVRRSKFNFVDLAGSERQNERKLRASDEENRHQQGTLVLGNVISAALSDPKSRRTFVPYRDSNSRDYSKSRWQSQDTHDCVRLTLFGQYG